MTDPRKDLEDEKEEPPFRFPKGMEATTAQEMLAGAYGDLDEGKLLRRTLKEQRRAGLDPPLDVQYVAEPRVEGDRDALGVSLNADILVYEDFEEAEACRDVFEDVLATMLLERLEHRLRAWTKARGP